MKFGKYQTRGAYHWDWYQTEDWYKKCVDRCVDFCQGTTYDVGCGDGLLLSKLPKGSLGIDPEEEAIKICEQKGLSAVHGDAGQYSAREFDYLVALNVIEHLEKPEILKTIFTNNIVKAGIIITDMPQEQPSKHHIKEYDPLELVNFFLDVSKYVTHFMIDKNYHGVEIYK